MKLGKYSQEVEKVNEYNNKLLTNAQMVTKICFITVISHLHNYAFTINPILLFTSI